MTKAQKEAQIRNVQLRRNVARCVLVAGLLLSLGANVMQSYALGWMGWVIAGLAPLSLFGSMLFMELLGNDIAKWKLVLSYGAFGAIALMSGYSSYLHIYRLSYGVSHDVVYSAIVPLMIDIPMILASVLLSEARKAPRGTEVPAKAAKPAATATAAVRGIKSAPSRARSTRQQTATA